MNCCSGYYVHCRQRFFQICRQCLAEPRGAAWLTVANDRYSVSWKSDRPPTENNYAKNLLYSCHPKAAAIAYLIREANEASQQALEGQTDTSSSPRATSLLPTNSLQLHVRRRTGGRGNSSRFSRFFSPTFLVRELSTTSS